MTNKCVSIVVPIYKVPEKYLRKCIESIQSQTLKDIQILLVDDGSPDNCGDICEEYASNDSRIILIHKDNGGLSSARNAGQRAATGEYLMFVDGDDWIEPDMCEKLYSIAQNTNVELVMCGMYRDYASSSDIYKIGLEDKKIYLGDECKKLQEKLFEYNCNIAVVYSKLIKKSLLDDNNIYHDEKLKQGAEGLEFNLRLFDKLNCATFTKESYYHYIYNENSISSTSTDLNNELVVRCYSKILELINSSDNSKNLIPKFYNRFIYVIVTTAISGYFNPNNTDNHKERVRKFTNYLRKPLVERTINSADLSNVNKQRKLILWLIKNRFFLGLEILGYIRIWQKKHK
ncbi:glycosyltransferase [Butyrivibrio fibrisolvens]|uniref:glycosyltransferase n=1 Tax=Butyrivibrio fibrisolvens TaxID=831 RepID=UPI0020BD8C0A|nr:glycosyltransferase [Butyrivibrio fibrisolvens]